MYFVLEWIRWSFFILHAALASGVSSSKEIGREEEVEHLSHAEVNLLKWWDLVREEVENPRLPLLFFSPFLSLSLFPSRRPHGGSKILGAEQQLQDEVAMHKLRQWLYSSLTVWCADNTCCVITFHRWCLCLEYQPIHSCLLLHSSVCEMFRLLWHGCSRRFQKQINWSTVGKNKESCRQMVA